MGYDDREEQGTQEGRAIEKADKPLDAPLSSSALDIQERAQIDIQIATAKKYPRSIASFRERAITEATIDKETASLCVYALSRGGKKFDVRSIRLAEIVAGAWGNMKHGVRIIGDDGRWITAQAFISDMESNNHHVCEYRRRITDKNGRRYSEDMIQLTGAAACSFALRNAIFRVVPFAHCKPIIDACKKVIMGGKTVEKMRSDAMAYWKSQGIGEDRILFVLERPSVLDITSDDLFTLLGIFNAIKAGETTLEESFPDPAKAREEAAATPASVAPSAAPANTLNPDAAAKRIRIRDLKLKAPADVWAKALAGVGMTAIELGACDDLPTLDAIIEALGGNGAAKGGAA